MVTATQVGRGASCRYDGHVTAGSVNGKLAFHLNGLSKRTFNYGTAIKTIRLTALISMLTKVYRELEMSVFNDGTKVCKRGTFSV